MDFHFACFKSLKSHRHDSGINLADEKEIKREGEGGLTCETISSAGFPGYVAIIVYVVHLLSLPPAAVDERIKRPDTFRSFG